MPADPPLFIFDVSSPYAYLAAERIDDVLPVTPVWTPISFGALNRQTGKVPWSLRDETRDPGMRTVEARARERGLPPVRWPEGWPTESYSLLPLRALVFARDSGRDRELAHELFRTAFAEGVALNDLDVVAAAAGRCDLDREQLRAAVARQEVKDELRAATDHAHAIGVTGVPTVVVGEELYWGDDRLEDAARALS
jgi:2-hydroxychromene-2-carboxylate isomerase